MAQLAYYPQQQQQSRWCWAAIAASVDRLFSGSKTQCEIANLVTGASTCCSSPASSTCNVFHSLQLALERVERFRPPLGGSKSFDEVRAEIDARRPVGVRLVWDGGSDAHTVCIYGYETGPQRLWIGDPFRGSRVLIRFDEFPRRYERGGRWTHSYFTKR